MLNKFICYLISGLLSSQIALCGTAQADVMPRDKVVQIFTRSVYNPDVVDGKAIAYGLSPEKTKLMHSYYRALAKDRKFIERLADEYVSVGFNDSKNFKDYETAKQQALVIMGVCIAKWQQKGAQRLPDSDFGQILRLSNEICRNLPAKVCKIYNVEGMGRHFTPYISLFERTVWKSLSVDQVAQWYGIQLRAMDAELNDFPPVANLSFDEQKIAEQAMETAFARAFEKMPRARAERITRTLANLQMASDQDACEASMFFLDLCANAPGTTGSLIRRSLLLQLGK